MQVGEMVLSAKFWFSLFGLGLIALTASDILPVGNDADVILAIGIIVGGYNIGKDA